MALIDLRPGLRNYLLTSTPIAAMVTDRVFPVRMLEGERRDSIVYFRAVETESVHYTGPSGLIAVRMQIDSWSESALNAMRLANLVKERLVGFSGIMSNGGNSPNDFVVVQGIFLLTGFEDYDGVAQMYRMSRDYNIVYEDQQ